MKGIVVDGMVGSGIWLEECVIQKCLKIQSFKKVMINFYSILTWY